MLLEIIFHDEELLVSWGQLASYTIRSCVAHCIQELKHTHFPVEIKLKNDSLELEINL